MSNPTLVGYSSNDFFYENPEYCGNKGADGRYVVGNTTETSTITDINSDNTKENQDSSGNNTLCITNEKYGKLLKESNSEITTADSRYD